MLALHLLQSALEHVNTLLMQEILADPKWADKLTDADRGPRGAVAAVLDPCELVRPVRTGHEQRPGPGARGCGGSARLTQSAERGLSYKVTSHCRMVVEPGKVHREARR
ncbi:hypothetical protein ACNPQM_41030 [Streptomyces sp. NPDC056231]|uniref:hypothetical protein n=1 Tax=Streptomyces sp. NPDC056231 TaxID=3345755 RepID=UPI003AAC9FD2